MDYTTGCAVTSGALIPVGPFKCVEGFFTGCFVPIHALEFDQAIGVSLRFNIFFHLAYHPLNDMPIVSNAMSHKVDWLSIVYSHLNLYQEKWRKVSKSMNLYSQLINSINECNQISYNEYKALGISKGLRKTDNSGILVGITSICDNYGSKDGEACEGKIIYRGIDIKELITDKNIGYEGIVYLLLSGHLPIREQLNEFSAEIGRIRAEAADDLEQIINKETGENIMNIMARCVLNLYDYDQFPDDISQENMVKQVLKIIALMPLISINVYDVGVKTLPYI